MRGETLEAIQKTRNAQIGIVTRWGNQDLNKTEGRNKDEK
jgi:hypothetical protein